MTKEEQRIAIAETQGWRKVYKGPERDNRWLQPDGKHYATTDEIPNYLSDLNAMHEAEERLNFEQCGIYSLELNEKLKQDAKRPKLKVGEFRWHATAAQRAEAFLRTVGRWKD